MIYDKNNNKTVMYYKITYYFLTDTDAINVN